MPEHGVVFIYFNTAFFGIRKGQNPASLNILDIASALGGEPHAGTGRKFFQSSELDETGLYLAWSAIPEFKGRRNVIFSWYCFHRREPLVDPAEAVDNYANLDDWPRMFARRVVGELMTAGDVRRLGRYLRQDLGIGLTPMRVRFPMHPEVNYSGVVPCSWRRQIFYLDPQPRHGIGVGFAAWFDRGHTLDPPLATRALQ